MVPQNRTIQFISWDCCHPVACIATKIICLQPSRWRQNATPGGGAFIDQVHFSNLQSSIIYMAQETGGTVIMNTNSFADGLNKVADDFDNYYSLGFTSGTVESGRYHGIKVRLKGALKEKKYKVRHREGYRDKPMETRMADGTIAALHFGYQKNTMGIKIQFGTPQPEETT